MGVCSSEDGRCNAARFECYSTRSATGSYFGRFYSTSPVGFDHVGTVELLNLCEIVTVMGEHEFPLG